MIGMNSPSLPPVTLTDEAMKLAAVLLAVAADPAGTRSRLDELAGRITAVHAAVAEHDVAAKTAQDAAASLADLQERERNLASREDSLLKATTQLSVANHANANREDALNAREQALDRLQEALDSREKAMAAKAEQWRAALA
jgi:hypothetical protein